MQWFEALECYLAEFVRPFSKRPKVIGAIVECTGLPPMSIPCELIGGWWIEERSTTRGNIALHLFPSVV
jgi:hypothetical protein